MKWWGIIPWKSVARRVARRQGFVDPIQLSERIRRFAQPSEVGEPVELLRAGAVFHARGLINRAVQFNLDWVWPYWIERQFNPNDESFVPRAFSFSHINLTHRNWTAVGLPDAPYYPIVDPRGLITPLFDGWSIDFWIIGADGTPLLLPSKSPQCDQIISVRPQLIIDTRVNAANAGISSAVWMEEEGDGYCCVARVSAKAPEGASLVVTLRPYNPEGISFVDSVLWDSTRAEWHVSGGGSIRFNSQPRQIAMSCYSTGDVLEKLRSEMQQESITCSAGMATAAAVFPAGTSIEVRMPVVLNCDYPGGNGAVSHRHKTATQRTSAPRVWEDELTLCAQLEIPNKRWKRLHDTAVSTLILHAPQEVYPGPYTYKRFWYRDAALILNALSCVGAQARCRRALDLFPRGQLADGYFRSQEGEWDSNGEVLWIIERHFLLTGEPLPDDWIDMIEGGARWIMNKRLRDGDHAGLLPAGFSAEHLGLNDFYYWDDFWGIAGLESAARMLAERRPSQAGIFAQAAADFRRVVEQSVAGSAAYQRMGTFPAAPGRRMDSGAVGSLVADYPLQLFPPADPRILKTADWLIANSFHRGGFFQNMIHSGINAYLTLHVAQVLLRAGDRRACDAIDAVAALASSTGQWPEAIHPRTLGGCMGDGQHVWAAAEWVMMMRNLFVREEAGKLVIGAGLRPDWLRDAPVKYGPTATQFGALTIEISSEGGETVLNITPQWHREEPPLEIAIPSCRATRRGLNCFVLDEESAPVS